MPKTRWIEFQLEQPLEPGDDSAVVNVYGGPDNVILSGGVFSADEGSHGIAVYDPIDGQYVIVAVECP